MENSIMIGFILSVISGLVANFISNKLDTSNKLDFNMEPKIMYKNISKDFDDYEAEFIREQNRKIVNDKFNNFIFYVISYIIVGAAFYYPLMFSASSFGSDIDLNKTKLGVDFVLHRDDFIIGSAICAFVFYIPILYLSKKVAYVISLLLTNFWKITNQKKIALRILIIGFLALFLGANIFYLLKLKILWWDAIKSTFLIILFIFTLGANP